MPLRDHFHPPLQLQYPWDSLHSSWATRLADALNDEWLPPDFLAIEHTHAGTPLEIDVATFEGSSLRSEATTKGDVRVFSTLSGLRLVGAIEIISPSNKDRAEERRAFATKCASYLHHDVSLVMLDIVTNQRANLHNETMRLMHVPDDMDLPPEVALYGVAYRPVRRQEQSEIDIWTNTCSVGSPLPTLPLRLTGDHFVPVDFETTYQETCLRRRIH